MFTKLTWTSVYTSMCKRVQTYSNVYKHDTRIRMYVYKRIQTCGNMDNAYTRIEMWMYVYKHIPIHVSIRVERV